MKKLLLSAVAALLLFSSCKKDSDDNNSSTFTAKQDGTTITFKVSTATLALSESTKEKRLDITGVSTDGTKTLTLTYYEPNADNNGISAKDYSFWYFNNDDESTPEDESEDTNDGLFTYGVKIGANWYYDVYGTQGSGSITSNDSNGKKASGTFKAKLLDLDDNSVVTEFTEGKFSNISYTIIKL